MKKWIIINFFFLLSATVFSQQMGVGVLGGGMYRGFNSFDYEFSPHDGYKSGIQSGGGISIFRFKEGRNNEDNLRFNSLGLVFYGEEADSIHVKGINKDNYYPDTLYKGVQKTHYTFLTLKHQNYFKANWNEFTYFIIGFHLGAVVDKSHYTIQGYDQTQYDLDPSVDGKLPERLTGAFFGLNAGAAYEFNHFFLHFNVGYDLSFFFFEYYTLGQRISADLGVDIPIILNR
jgi:hypothetical protein